VHTSLLELPPGVALGRTAGYKGQEKEEMKEILMNGLTLLLFLLATVVITLILRYKRRPLDKHLPPPNWRCSRGGRDYF
jgi:hypothetical protein